MVQITVRHPNLSGDVTAEDIAVLAAFDYVIAEHSVKYFCNTSNPYWEFDTTVEPAKYFRLIIGHDQPREVFSYDIDTLRHLTPEEFHARFLSASFNHPDNDSSEPSNAYHALQRTAPRVTLAASGLRLSPTMHLRTPPGRLRDVSVRPPPRPSRATTLPPNACCGERCGVWGA